MKQSPLRIATLTVAVSAVLVLAVWLIGPRIGLPSPLSRWIALGILVLGLAVAGTVAFVSYRRSSRHEAPPDGSIPDAPAMASLNAHVVGERLDRTIQWLRNSKLADHGRDPLYELPWYLVVGALGSGKSSLIVQSRCSFSYTEPKKPMGRAGASPTDNCDIWVANEAVFIDPSGRYFADDSSQQSWTGLLSQIGKRRRARPVDGMVLVVDVDSLLGADRDSLCLQAERMRSCLDTTARAFGMVLPIYLVFTKADAIDGFEECFDSIGDLGGVPFGSAFRNEQRLNPHPEEEFRSSFSELHRWLLSRRNSALQASGGKNLEKIFGFPSQFPLIEDALSAFVELLFRPNQFREQPLLRGFYFVSSLQTPSSRNPLAELMQSKAGLPRAPQSAVQQQTKSYFIQPLLTRVIIPDRGLAGVSREVRRRRLRVRMAGWGFAGVVLPISLIAFAWGAYRDSRGLVSSAAAVRAIDGTAGKTAESVSRLLALQRKLAIFECRETTPKCETHRRFFWGLHPPQAALEAAGAVYRDRLNTLFIAPLLNADRRLGHKYDGLRTQLALISAPQAAPSASFDSGKAYNLLKTFLMFSSPAKADPAFLVERSRDSWLQGAPDATRSEAVALLAFYLHQLGDHRNPGYRVTRSPRDNEAIDRIRKLLLVIEPDLYYYQSLRDEGRRRIDGISLKGVLSARGLHLLEGGDPIDGAYTKVGWDTFVKDRIASMTKDYEQERSWVLGTAGSQGTAGIDEKLTSYYFRDYQRYWWEFLRNIRMDPFEGLQDASQQLAILADPQQSPLLPIFKTVSVNTWSDLDSMKPEESARDGARGMRFDVARRFRAVHGMAPEASLGQYLKALSRLQVVIRTFLDSNQPAGQIPIVLQETDAALQTVNALLVAFDPDGRQAVEPIVKAPIQLVMSLVAKSAPVGAVKDERQRALIAGGVLKEKDKSLQGATVILLESYSENKLLPEKEIMRAVTREGAFEFPKRVNPGAFKVCAAKKGDKNFFCGDVRLDGDSATHSYDLNRPRSMVVFGGGKLSLVLRVRQ